MMKLFKDLPIPDANDAEKLQEILMSQFEIYKEMSIRNFEKRLDLQSTIMLEESAAIAEVWQRYNEYVWEVHRRKNEQ